MKVDQNKCVGCGACCGMCSCSAITLVNGKAEIDTTKCCNCHTCMSVCPMQAISE